MARQRTASDLAVGALYRRHRNLPACTSSDQAVARLALAGAGADPVPVIASDHVAPTAALHRTC